MWFSITDACPNACWHVIIVKDTVTNELIAYCRDCGAAWATPSDFANNAFTIASRTLTAGIVQPTPREIAESEWRHQICAEVNESDYGSVAEIEIAMETERKKLA